ncbi:MAG TPA: hypothetical protein VN176_02535 [Verrucomicrobiae bacterium]|jgi:hypothetical protein|nr:hypothetical protein [Verrucomicrobiae bacterium]
MPESPGSTSTTTDAAIAPPLGRSWGVLALAVLEALCVFSVAIARAGIVLGASSAAAVGWANFFHRDIFRLPVLFLAIAGALFNLYLLWNARRLRNAPAAAWRKRPLTRRESWRIGLVFTLSLVTLATAATEIYFHRAIHHTIM